VTFEIDKYKKNLGDLILIGDLPVGEKYKDFLKVVVLFRATYSLVKNMKIS
jgi:hypothetical protein